MAEYKTYPDPGNMATFNINDGYIEGLIRGYKSRLLNQNDYTNLAQCDTLEDVKLILQATEYNDFLNDEIGPLHATTFGDACTRQMVSQFNHIRAQCVEPLATFMDYMTYQYMIDNIVLLITGTMNEKDLTDLREKFHPLGLYDEKKGLLESSSASRTIKELKDDVLIETPLAPYLRECDHLEEMNIEVVRNTLYKAYLEDFLNFCVNLGGTTAEFMTDILNFEADRRTINITLNSFGRELSKDDRAKLFPKFGLLVPEGTKRLAKVQDSEENVKQILEPYPTYKNLMTQDRPLEDAFYQKEVEINMMAFDLQFGYGVLYAFFKLKEQEIRNIVWICECISQKQRDKIDNYIPLFN